MPRQKKQNSNNDENVKDVQNMIKQAVAKKNKQVTKNQKQTYIKHADSMIDQINDNDSFDPSVEGNAFDENQFNKDLLNDDSSVMSDLRDSEKIGDAFEDYDAKKSKKSKMPKKSKGTINSSIKAKKTVKSYNDEDHDPDNQNDDKGDEGDENQNEDVDYDELTEGAKKEYIQTVVLDKVINYIKLDDIIKQKQLEHKKEMKVIKDSKEQLEEFLIQYLDKVDEEFIELGNKSTLYKTEIKTKAAPKMEDIGICLVEGFKKYEFYEDDDEIKRVVKDFIDTIDAKREVKTRKYLKRKKGDADANNKKANKDNDNKSQVSQNNVPKDNQSKGIQKEQPKKKEDSEVKPKGRKSNK